MQSRIHSNIEVVEIAPKAYFERKPRLPPQKKAGSPTSFGCM